MNENTSNNMNKSITFIRKKGTVILSQTRNMKITTWLGAGFVLGMGIGVLNASFAIINYQDKTAGKEVIKALINESEIEIKNHNTHLHSLSKDRAKKHYEAIRRRSGKKHKAIHNLITSSIKQLDKNIERVSNNVNGWSNNIISEIKDIKTNFEETIDTKTNNIKAELQGFTQDITRQIKESNSALQGDVLVDNVDVSTQTWENYSKKIDEVLTHIKSNFDLVKQRQNEHFDSLTDDILTYYCDLINRYEDT